MKNEEIKEKVVEVPVFQSLLNGKFLFVVSLNVLSFLDFSGISEADI